MFPFIIEFFMELLCLLSKATLVSTWKLLTRTFSREQLGSEPGEIPSVLVTASSPVLLGH